MPLQLVQLSSASLPSTLDDLHATRTGIRKEPLICVCSQPYELRGDRQTCNGMQSHALLATVFCERGICELLKLELAGWQCRERTAGCLRESACDQGNGLAR